MQTIEKTIEVERPVSAVYDQWTRFQDFPKFMEGIKVVRESLPGETPHGSPHNIPVFLFGLRSFREDQPHKEDTDVW